MPLSKERNRERMRHLRVQPKVEVVQPTFRPVLYPRFIYDNEERLRQSTPMPLPNSPDGGQYTL